MCSFSIMFYQVLQEFVFIFGSFSAHFGDQYDKRCLGKYLLATQCFQVCM